MTEKTNVSENPAVEVAKVEGSVLETDTVQTLSTGIRVRLKAVSASLIEEVRNRIKDPNVPVVYDEEKDRELQNPNDPDYLRALEEAEEARNVAATDAMLMFGVELVDSVPEDKEWIKKLKFLDIEVDESDEYALEFAYKKYIAVGTPDLPKVYTASAPVTGEGVAKQMASFPGDDEGPTDTGSTDS